MKSGVNHLDKNVRSHSKSSSSDFSEDDNPFNDIKNRNRLPGQASFGSQGSFVKESKKQDAHINE
jgi:hypothetical protein